MKYTVKERIPDYISGRKAKEHEVNSIDDIFELDFIKTLTKEDFFKEFEIKEYVGNKSLLMMHTLDDQYWVIAFITDNENGA